MRRFLTLLCAASASVLFLGGGTSSAQNGSQGAENLVAGTGTIFACCGEPMVHVNAQSREGGVDPRGHFWIRYPSGVEFGGDVVCLTVIANSASLTGRIDRVKVGDPANEFVAGRFLNIDIVDNGSPGTFDLVNFHKGTTTPQGCPVRAADLPISQGNYVVHDKPVLNFSALDLLLAQFEAEANHP